MATVNQEIHQKFKKLTIRQEADGHENKAEVREDEEQSLKLQEIIDLLVAAGYFRARIKGLSPFDKVVGGMTWCIESCNVDIDVDLLFQENSTIGQKISLTEKIVAVLPKMKCPHRIEPHQIQGLDFIHIFPVIQWLVKRSMEFREEMSAFVRSYAVNQFGKHFPLRNAKAEVQKKVLDNVNTVTEVYRPRRYYKRKNTLPDDVAARVQITLLEYGRHGVLNNTQTKTTETDILGDQQSQELQIDQLMTNMAVMNENSLEYNVLSKAELEKLSQHYAELKSEMKDGGIKSKEEKQISVMEKRKLLLEERTSKLQEDKERILREIAENKTALQEIKSKELEVNRSLQEMESSINPNTHNVKEIEELVKLNDSLRTQEAQFREQCKLELAQLQNKIQDAKKSTPEENHPEANKELEEEAEKLRVLRLHLAKRNRITSMLQRQLDDIPTRPELAQYQRRFLELYNQVAAKHKETKQYFTLYNTLEDTKFYMSKELSILNSISENYPEAMQSGSSREDFLKQFENIVEGVKHSKFKLEGKLAEEKHKRDQLSHTLQGLVEQQRHYVGAVRQLSIECRRHETLQAQCNNNT